MGNYTVTCSSHGNVVYSGSSESEYNRYRRGSRQCSQCHAEDARSAREAAQRRAEQRARDERARVQARQAELERMEREKQIADEQRRKREREAEKQRMKALREQQEAERQRLRASMLAQSTEEITQKANEMKSQNQSPKNPFLHYKKLETLKTVTEIKDRVNEFAYVGAIVTERANQVINELEDSLGDDYDMIKVEMDRYKKYGQEMSSMTDVFKDEFSKVFNPSVCDADFEEMAQLHNMSEETKDEEEKTELVDEVKETLDGLNNAIKNVEAKLFLMEQYYDQMIIDYKHYKSFISLKQDELSAVSRTFTNLAEVFKNVERGVLDGTGDSQEMEFTEDYEVQVTGEEKTGWAMKDAVATGAIIGGAAGAVAGGVAGGIPGALGGMVVGATIGAGIGAICSLCNPPEYKVTTTTVTTSLTYTAPESMKVTYSGQELHDALKKIVQGIQDSNAYKSLTEEMEKSRQEADNNLEEAKRLKREAINIGTKIRNYKLEMKGLTDKFKPDYRPIVTESQAGRINRRLKSLSTEIKIMVDTMK